MKHDDIITKASEALASVVGDIIASDDDAETKAAALAENFRQAEAYLQDHLAVGKDDDTYNHRSPPPDQLHASKVANLLVEAGSHTDRASALQHLLHTKEGAALLHRLHKQEGTTPMDNWTAILKDHGVCGVANLFVEDRNSYGMTEPEFTAEVTKLAKREHPSLSDAQAFEKVFCANDSRGKLLREAHALTKYTMPVMVDVQPVVVSGDETRDVDQDRAAAYDALMDKARELHAKFPELTAAQAFERVFTASENRALMERATQRPRPQTSFPPPMQTEPWPSPSTKRDTGDALVQLQKIAADSRRDGETEAQAFARVYASNPDLAAAERAQNRPVG